MAKAGTPKKKKAKPKLTDKEQSERRFMEAVRKLGVDKSGKDFDAALEILIPRRPKSGNRSEK